MWQDLKAVPVIQPVQAGQPVQITRKLKSFQLEGLNWMIRQEQSQWKGGLLGDEMGMSLKKGLLRVSPHAKIL